MNDRRGIRYPDTYPYGAGKDGCEWNPDKDELAYDNDTHQHSTGDRDAGSGEEHAQAMRGVFTFA